MPIVRINVVEGKSTKYKKACLTAVHDALVDAFEIEDSDRFQRIVEFPKDDFEYSPDKTAGFMIIEITCFPGRTAEQKRIAIECICANLYDQLGIEPSDVFVIFNDQPYENWGLAGRQQHP